MNKYLKLITDQFKFSPMKNHSKLLYKVINLYNNQTFGYPFSQDFRPHHIISIHNTPKSIYIQETIRINYPILNNLVINYINSQPKSFIIMNINNPLFFQAIHDILKIKDNYKDWYYE